MNPEAYIAFLKLCAENHPEIQHDDQARKRFSTYGERVVTQISGGNLLEIKDFCLLIYTTEFDAPFYDAGAQSRKDYSFNFEVCRYCEPNDSAAQLIAQNTAENICQDICNEMKHYILENIAPFHRGTDIYKAIQGNPTTGGKANLYGHRVEVPVRVQIPGAESHIPFTL